MLTFVKALCGSLLAAPTLSTFLVASKGTELSSLARSRPEIFRIAIRGYQAAIWPPQIRAKRIIEHCDAIDQLGGALKFKPGEVIDLIQLPAVNATYRITIDQARWLMREGLLTFSLWDGVDRIFSIAFSLRYDAQSLVAYIGGLQGRKGNGVDYYRAFSNFAYRARPQDFLLEIFKMFCRKIGVSKILGVEDRNHYSQTPGPFRSTQTIMLSYNSVWMERGGIRDDKGFYDIPLAASRRCLQTTPAKKRGMYRERYKLLDMIEANFDLSRIST